MTIEEYNSKGVLKSGYTTGTCATAATKAAVFILFGNSPKECEAVKVNLPIGLELQIPIEEVDVGENFVSVTVRKYSGDDPDITDGMLIGAKVEFLEKNENKLFEVSKMVSMAENIMKTSELEQKNRDILKNKARNRKTSALECKNAGNFGTSMDEFQGMDKFGVQICGGIGIGRITKEGLRLSVGEPAINPTPREMICSEIEKMKKEYKITSDIRVTIFAPEGEEIAKKTFNPKLGIQGGISILGTTGLVMPMSSKALIETIEVEMKFQKVKSERIVAAPGAYGSSFLKSYFHTGKENLVEFSNYPGEMLDIAVKLEVKELVICGHIGKMVKLAGGIMNTHSNDADARLELMAAHVLKMGAKSQLIEGVERKLREHSVTNLPRLGNEKNVLEKGDYFDISLQILDCLTTSEAVEILKQRRILESVMQSLAYSMLKYIHQRLEKAMAFQKKSKIPKVELIVYTLEDGLLARVGEQLICDEFKGNE